MTSRKSNWLAAACMTAVSCAASMAEAQDGGAAGIVRISDRRIPAQTTGFHGNHGYAAANSGYGGCPNGNCQSGNCYGGGNPECFGGLFREHYCKNSPDHGYSVPAKYPLHRRGAQYTSYFLNQWYGTPGASYAGGFPMVYQPTDTSQLGFSYQHVPFWQPSANVMPQRPVPANWHIAAPTVYASAFHNTGWPGYAPFGQYTPPFGGYDGVNAHYGAYGYVDVGMIGQPCPANQQPGAPANQAPQSLTPAPPPPETPTPVQSPAAGIPPVPRQFEDSAESGHIRRAAY